MKRLLLESRGKLTREYQYASNMRVAEYSCGAEVMISYQTPVAGKDYMGWFETDRKFSSTTSRQIVKYLSNERKGNEKSRVETQSWIENLHYKQSQSIMD
jgi:hypothetical protein